MKISALLKALLESASAGDWSKLHALFKTYYAVAKQIDEFLDSSWDDIQSDGPYGSGAQLAKLRQMRRLISNKSINPETLNEITGWLGQGWAMADVWIGGRVIDPHEMTPSDPQSTWGKPDFTGDDSEGSFAKRASKSARDMNELKKLEKRLYVAFKTFHSQSMQMQSSMTPGRGRDVTWMRTNERRFRHRMLTRKEQSPVDYAGDERSVDYD